MGQVLQVYEITNRTTGEKHFTAAETAQNACEQTGWTIEDCFIHIPKPRRLSSRVHNTQHYIRVPCNVCPFQYHECIKSDIIDCPHHPNTTDPILWLKKIRKVAFCSFKSEKMLKKDHKLAVKYITKEEAIKEFTPKRLLDPDSPP